MGALPEPALKTGVRERKGEMSMKKSIFAGVLAACLLGCTLSGCQMVGKALDSLPDELGRQLSTQLSKEAGEQLPSIAELAEFQDRSDDHREQFPYTPGEESSLVLDVRNTSQVIVYEEERADLQFEYDPAHFKVTVAPDDGFLVLKIREQASHRILDSEEGNYKCIITLPKGVYQQMQAVGKHGGVAFMEPSVPVMADGTGMGLTFSYPKADVSIRGDSGSFYAEIGKDYTGSFQFSGKAGAFCLNFPDGEPDPLDFHLSAGSGAMVALPEGWGDPLEGADYSTGTGGAAVSLELDAGAGVVSVG